MEERLKSLGNLKTNWKMEDIEKDKTFEFDWPQFSFVSDFNSEPMSLWNFVVHLVKLWHSDECLFMMLLGHVDLKSQFSCQFIQFNV